MKNRVNPTVDYRFSIPLWHHGDNMQTEDRRLRIEDSKLQSQENTVSIGQGGTGGNVQHTRPGAQSLSSEVKDMAKFEDLRLKARFLTGDTNNLMSHRWGKHQIPSAPSSNENPTSNTQHGGRRAWQRKAPPNLGTDQIIHLNTPKYTCIHVLKTFFEYDYRSFGIVRRLADNWVVEKHRRAALAGALQICVGRRKVLAAICAYLRLFARFLEIFFPPSQGGLLRRGKCGKMGEEGNIEHRTSNIEHRTSNIEHRTSNIEHRTSNAENRREDGGRGRGRE